MPDDTKLSPADLAARCGVGIQTIYDWNWRGTGPPYTRIRRRIFYNLADVEVWEAETTEIVNARTEAATA